MNKSSEQDVTNSFIEQMRKSIPSYPYPFFPEKCPRCNMLKDMDVHVIRKEGTKGAVKIILYDKEGDREGNHVTLWGPIEQCDDCGRKLSITKEKGVELLD